MGFLAGFPLVFSVGCTKNTRVTRGAQDEAPKIELPRKTKKVVGTPLFKK